MMGNQNVGMRGGWGGTNEYCTKRKIMDPIHAAMYRDAENCPAKHERFIWPATEAEEAIIIADSLLKKVRHLRRTQVYAIPGVRIERLTDEIRRGVIDISYQNAILVCAGTNNLSKDSPELICDKMSRLIDVIRSRNAECQIMISGIIIRPVDEDEEKVYKRKGDPSLITKRRDANDLLESMVRARGATMFETWRALMVGSYANRAMYGDDGLHLSDKGIRRITQYLINCLGGALPQFYSKST
jgi:lysophospholipase L1-like esterase